MISSLLALPTTALAAFESMIHLESNCKPNSIPPSTRGCCYYTDFRNGTHADSCGRVASRVKGFKRTIDNRNQTTMDRESQTIRPYPRPGASLKANRSSDRDGDDWEIGVFGDLTDKQPELFAQLLDVPAKSKGTIFFDSGGGSAYVGLAMASMIRLRGLSAVGVVAGECSSAAILPFAACKERYVTQHSTLLFHPIRWSSDEEVRLEEAAEWARHFQRLEEDLDQLLARMLDFPEETIREWTRPGRFVTGAELVEAGLAKMIDLFSGDLWSQIKSMQGE